MTTATLENETRTPRATPPAAATAAAARRLLSDYRRALARMRRLLRENRAAQGVLNRMRAAGVSEDALDVGFQPIHARDRLFDAVVASIGDLEELLVACVFAVHGIKVPDPNRCGYWSWAISVDGTIVAVHPNSEDEKPQLMVIDPARTIPV